MLKKRFLITALLMLFTLSFVQAYAQSGENDTVFVETVVLDGPPSVDTLIPVKIRLVNTFELAAASLGFYYGSDDIVIDSVSKVGASCAHINIYNSFAEPDSNLGVIGFVKLMEPQGVIPGDSLLSTLWFTVPAGTPEQFIPIDSGYFPPAGPFVLTNTSGYSVKPQFVGGGIQIGTGGDVPSIELDPTSLTFDAVEGGSNPAMQSFDINNVGTGDLEWTATESINWLSLDSYSGTAPSTVGVNIDITGLTAGTYTGDITISDPDADNDPQVLSVTLNVAPPPPELSVDPTELNFTTDVDVNPASQSFDISNIGGGTLNWTATEGVDWINLSAYSGTAPSTVDVNIDVTGVAPGDYTADVTVEAAGANSSPQTVTINLTVEAIPPALSVDPTALTYSAQVDGANPADQSFDIANTGGGTLSWTATETVDWLSLSATSGTAPATVDVSVDITGLAAGTHNADITVEAAGADNSPQVVSVTLNLADEDPMIVLTPTSYEFNLYEGDGSDTEAFDITNGGGGTLNWSASNVESWLTVNPTSGTAPSAVDVTVSASGLPVGTYTDVITVTSPTAANSPQTFDVTLNIIEVPEFSITQDGNPVTLLDFTVSEDAPTASDTIELSSTTTEEIEWDAMVDQLWLGANPGSGTTPSSLTVLIDMTGYSPGTYSGILTIMEAAKASPVEIPVTVTVEAAPGEFDVTPTSLTFVTEEDVNPAPQDVTIESTSGDLAWTAAKTETWLNLSPDNGTTPSTMTVSIDVTGLPAGFYTDMITISEAPPLRAEPVEIAVELTITETVQPILAVDPTTLDFVGLLGDPNPAAQTVSITNAGTGTLEWTASFDAPWLSLSSMSGTAPSSVDFMVDITGMDPGDYLENVTITADDAEDSPQMVTVNLTVNAPDPQGGDSVWVAHETTNVGDQAMVEVTFSNDNDVAGIHLPMYFDPTIVNLDSVSFAGSRVEYIDMLVSTIDNGDGTVNLGVIPSEEEDFVGPGNGLLATLYFTGVAEGVSPIDTGFIEPASEYLFVDPWVTAFYPEFYAGSVTVEEVQEVKDTVRVESVHVQALESDSVRFGVPVYLFNNVEIAAASLGFYYDSPQMRIDSLSRAGASWEHIDINQSFVDPAEELGVIGFVKFTEPNGILPGDSLLGTFWFTLYPNADSQVVPIDSGFFPPAGNFILTNTDGFSRKPAYVPGDIIVHPVEVEPADLAVDPNSLDFGDVCIGEPNPAPLPVMVTNAGGGTLNWGAEVTSGEDWLSIDPMSGTAPSEITVTADVAGVPVGDYVATITITSPDAANSPQMVECSVTVCPQPEEGLAGNVYDEESGDPLSGVYVDIYDMYPTSMVATGMTDTLGYFEFPTLMDGDYTVRVHKEGYYPILSEESAVDLDLMYELVAYGDVHPTNEWINAFCEFDNYFNGYQVQPGDVIEAYAPGDDIRDGHEVLCGQWIVTDEGTYGFMPIYRDDDFTDPKDGAWPGDPITMKINGYPDPNVDLNWTENGDNFEVCLDVYPFCSSMIVLNQGWNLISWNEDTEDDDVETIIADVKDNVDVILSFENGALTYDPLLPGFNTLKHMDHLHGYWFNMDAEDTLYLEGACVDAETPIALEMGWNLVSYLPNEADSVQNALACILDKVIVVLGFDNGAQTYVPTMKEFSTLTMLRPLFGYWIKMTADDYLVYGGCYNPAFAKEGIDQHTNNMNAVTPTNIWHDLYGEAVIVDGNLLPAGTVIEAVDLNGNLVGSCVAQTEGKFGFMSVYGAEEDGAGLKVGDEFQLRIDGRLSEEVFTFEGTGSRTFVGNINLKSGGSAVIPEQYNLAQNYPNPFNPVTSIAYEIPSDCKVTLTVYNILGEKVTTLVDQHQSAGAYTVEWNGETDAGIRVSSGIYFYRLNAGDYTKSMKMTLMK